jgi:hypothetical protein
MRGLKDNNFPAFYQTEGMLQLWGYTTINPARMDIEAGKAQWNVSMGQAIPDSSFTIEEALRRDFSEILARVDAVVVLYGWEKSVGATREVAFATSVGIPVYEMLTDRPLDLGVTEPINVQVDLQCYDVDGPRAGYEPV